MPSSYDAFGRFVLRSSTASSRVLLAALALASASCTTLDTGDADADPMDGGGAGLGSDLDASAAGSTAGQAGSAAGTRAGESGNGASGSGGSAGNDAETGCTPEGAMRCASAGSVARETCSEGTWIVAEPCAEGELCDSANQDAPGTCASAAQFCQGSADRSVCVSGVMHECNADAISVAQMQCESQRHCQAGLDDGSCATCLPGETYRCEGAQLEVCSDDGMGFTLDDTCETEALCNAQAKACTADACLEDTHDCASDDTLRVCNEDRTGFEDVMPCDPGLCDETDGQCDVCAPGDKSCMGGESATCDDEGQGYDLDDCEAPRSICAGQGVCVECIAATDCTGTPPRCRANTCNVGTGNCSTTITGGAACTPDAGGTGVCTDLGACVSCLQDEHCTNPNAPRCDPSSRTCVPCLGNGDCTSSGASRCDTSTHECVECVQAGDCSTTQQCRAAYCDSSNECAVMIDVGASCGGSNVCNSGGSCVDCLGDVDCTVASLPHCRTDTNACVECTANAHCTSGEEIRCNTSNNTCVQCTSNAHCTTPGQTRCDTTDGECVECTTASQCGNLIDWDCNDNSCVRLARCGNGIIEPEIGEQCDDPTQIGQNTCNSSCQIAGYYAACDLANGPTCPEPFDDSGCGEVVPGEPRFCAPGCNGTDASCPNLVGWTERCVFTACMIGCNAGICPIGYTCTHVDFGGGNTFDVCTIVD